MKSAKALKLTAIDDPERIGKPENLRAVEHYLVNSEGTERAYAADAAVKLAFADPQAAVQLQETLEEVAHEFTQPTVDERVDRALSHIGSQADVRARSRDRQDTSDTESADRNTKIYSGSETSSEVNYCAVCGTALPNSGPVNFCPNCGSDIS